MIRGNILALFFLLGLPCVIKAEPQARPRDGKAPKVTAVVLVDQVEGVSPRMTGRLSRTLFAALKKNERLRIVTASKRLEAFAGEAPTDVIEGAKKSMERAFQLLEKDQARQSLAAFSQARAAQTRALAHVKRRDVALAQFGHALAYFKSNLHPMAMRTLVELFTWRPALKVDEDALPSAFVAMVARAKRAAKQSPRGTLVIRTSPEGSRAYLNGQSVGKTPLELEGVPVGGHFLTLRRHGYFRRVVAVRVPRPGRFELTFPLKENEKYLLLEQAMKRTWPDFGVARASPAMREIRTVLSVDQVILVRPSPATDSAVRVEVCLYDLRTGNLLKRLAGTVPLEDATPFVTNLYADVRYDGSLHDPGVEKVEPFAGPKPVWKRWWFWTAVGAAVAATVTSIAVPLALRDKGSEIPGGFQGISVSF